MGANGGVCGVALKARDAETLRAFHLLTDPFNFVVTSDADWREEANETWLEENLPSGDIISYWSNTWDGGLIDLENVLQELDEFFEIRGNLLRVPLHQRMQHAWDEGLGAEEVFLSRAPTLWSWRWLYRNLNQLDCFGPLQSTREAAQRSYLSLERFAAWDFSVEGWWRGICHLIDRDSFWSVETWT